MTIPHLNACVRGSESERSVSQMTSSSSSLSVHRLPTKSWALPDPTSTCPHLSIKCIILLYPFAPFVSQILQHMSFVQVTLKTTGSLAIACGETVLKVVRRSPPRRRGARRCNSPGQDLELTSGAPGSGGSLVLW